MLLRFASARQTAKSQRAERRTRAPETTPLRPSGVVVSKRWFSRGQPWRVAVAPRQTDGLRFIFLTGTGRVATSLSSEMVIGAVYFRCSGSVEHTLRSHRTKWPMPWANGRNIGMTLLATHPVRTLDDRDV